MSLAKGAGTALAKKIDIGVGVGEAGSGVKRKKKCSHSFKFFVFHFFHNSIFLPSYPVSLSDNITVSSNKNTSKRLSVRMRQLYYHVQRIPILLNS